MNLYRNLGIVLFILSGIAIIIGIASFPFTDDYFWVGVVGLIILVLSIFLIKFGKDYVANRKINKKPFWFIVLSFIFAFVPPLLFFLFSIITWCKSAFGYECVLPPFFLFLFITGPIGAILFIIGQSYFSYRERKDHKKVY